MKRLLLIFLFAFAATICFAQKHHCIFIGTNIGDYQTSGNYIVVIGNFKPDIAFQDSSINIDQKFPYFKTPRGMILLSYIKNNYGKTSTFQFYNNLQLLIKKYYINHLALYIRNRRYDKTFYAFN